MFRLQTYGIILVISERRKLAEVWHCTIGLIRLARDFPDGLRRMV